MRKEQLKMQRLINRDPPPGKCIGKKAELSKELKEKIDNYLKSNAATK